MHIPSGTVGSPGGSERLDLWFWVAMVGVLHAGTSESAWDRAVHVQSVYTRASPFQRLLERQCTCLTTFDHKSASSDQILVKFGSGIPILTIPRRLSLFAAKTEISPHGNLLHEVDHVSRPTHTSSILDTHSFQL